MDASGEARQRGVEEGGRAVVPSETSLGEVTVTEERGDIVMARKTSNSGVGTNRKRSRNYGDGRRQSSTLLGKHLAAAALGLLLISLLALRFITCLGTLRSHKAGSLGIFPGATSRRLAGRQDDEGLPVASAGDGGSQNGQRETSPAGSEGDAGEAAKCQLVIGMLLSRSDATPGEPGPPAIPSGQEETPTGPANADTASGEARILLKGPTEADNESSKLVSESHLRPWLSMLTRFKTLVVIAAVLVLVGLVCGIAGSATSGGSADQLKIAGAVLTGAGVVTLIGALTRRLRIRYV